MVHHEAGAKPHVLQLKDFALFARRTMLLLT